MIGVEIDERFILNKNKENKKINKVRNMISENLEIEEDMINISGIQNIGSRGNINMYKITYLYNNKNYEIYGYSEEKNQIDRLFVFKIGEKKLVLSNYLPLSKENFNKFLKFYNNENNENNINENNIIEGNVQYKDDYINENNENNKIEVEVFTLYEKLIENKPFLMKGYNVISDILPFGFRYFDLNLIKKGEKNISSKLITYSNKTEEFSTILEKLKNNLEAKKIDGFNNIFSNNNIYLKYALVFYNIGELRLKKNSEEEEEERKKKEDLYSVFGNTYINKDYIKKNKLKDNEAINYDDLDYIDIIYPENDEKYIFKHNFIYPKENLFLKKDNQIIIKEINNIVNKNIFLNKDEIELMLDTSKIYNLLNNGVKIKEINNFKKHIKENDFNDKLKEVFNNNKNNNFEKSIKELIKDFKQEFEKKYQIKMSSEKFIQYIYNHIKVVSNIKTYNLKNIIENINQQNKAKSSTFIIKIVNVNGTETHIVFNNDDDNNKMFYANFLNKNDKKDKYKKIFSINPILSYLLKYNNRGFIFIPTEHYLNKYIKENILNSNNKYTRFLGSIANTNIYNIYENTFKNINIIYEEKEKEKNNNKIITSYKRLNIDGPFFEKDIFNSELNKFVLDKLDKNIILNKVKAYIKKVNIINNKENPYYDVLSNLFKNTAFQIELNNIFIDNLLSKNIL